MNTRRKFLLQGSLAATALIASKPMKTLAGSGSSLSLLGDDNKISLVHTHVNTPEHFSAASSRLGCVVKENSHSLVLNTGHYHSTESAYHAVLASNQQTTSTNSSVYIGSNFISDETTGYHAAHPYKIIYKGDVKIGVIGAVSNNHGLFSSIQTNTTEELDAIAGWLKSQHHCAIVICLSDLGGQPASKLNDQKMAAASEHIDVILGNDPAIAFKNASRVAMNRNNHEVIINYTNNNDVAIGCLSVGFDDNGRKNAISFNNAV